MPKYRVTVQVSGLSGENPTEVKSALDEQLKKSGIENCRIVGIDPDGISSRATSRRPPAASPVDSAWRRQANAGGLLLVAAAAWAIWFFWWMLSTAPE